MRLSIVENVGHPRHVSRRHRSSGTLLPVTSPTKSSAHHGCSICISLDHLRRSRAELYHYREVCCVDTATAHPPHQPDQIQVEGDADVWGSPVLEAQPGNGDGDDASDSEHENADAGEEPESEHGDKTEADGKGAQEDDNESTLEEDPDGVPVPTTEAGEITNKTKLVRFFNKTDFDKDDPYSTLIANLAKYGPVIRCSVVVEGTHMPASGRDFAFDVKGINCFMYFAKLLYAPVLRLKVQFRDAQSEGEAYHTIEIEFPWANDSMHDRRGLIDLSKGKRDPTTGLTRYTFTSYYAAVVRGMNVVRQKSMRTRLGDAGLEFVRLFRQFIDPKNGPNTIVLDVCPTPTMPAESKRRGAFAKPPKQTLEAQAQVVNEIHFDTNPDQTAIEALLPGGDGYLSERLFHLQYDFFRHNQGETQIAASAMKLPSLIMKRHPPHPMTSMVCESTYANIEEAAVQLGWHAEYQYQEQATSLALFREVQHNGLLYKAGPFILVPIRLSPFRHLDSNNAELLFRLPGLARVKISYMFSVKEGEDFKREISGFVSEVPVGRIPAADAYIFIGSHSADSKVGRDAMHVNDTRQRTRFKPLEDEG